ncbi:hypothetical protein [Echinicola salinicaeni]|uniref:hypothetical protein n=1 Tax=Echinicola salinicaeni TaxID=2762757 RepID=UPI0016464FED|nr:hypothetical protein [Echinicola salinicaeni]
MLEHPITAVLLIIGGTVGFTFLAVNQSNDTELSDSIRFRGYAGNLLFVIIGTSILINFSMLTAAITLMSCSIGVLIFGLMTKKIGIQSQIHKPQVLIFSIIGITTSVAILLLVNFSN